MSQSTSTPTRTASMQQKCGSGRIRRRHGRVQLLGCRHRPGAARRLGAASGPSPAIPTEAGGDERHRRATPRLRRPGGLRRVALRGATTLYNTYWVRFPHGRVDHDGGGGELPDAVLRRPPRRRAAHRARLDHPPEHHVPYPYFRGKAEVERILAEVGVSYGVLRPAILFGGDGVLLNNIAWLLRRLPVFAVGGTGRLPHPAHPRRRPGPPERGAPAWSVTTR